MFSQVSAAMGSTGEASKKEGAPASGRRGTQPQLSLKTTSASDVARSSHPPKLYTFDDQSATHTAAHNLWISSQRRGREWENSTQGCSCPCSYEASRARARASAGA